MGQSLTFSEPQLSPHDDGKWNLAELLLKLNEVSDGDKGIKSKVNEW